MKFINICLLFLCLNVVIEAQESQVIHNTGDALSHIQQKELVGIVSLTLDTLVLENYNKHLVQNSKNQGIEGYRIRIFSDIGQGAKDRQKRIIAKFLSHYPDISIYPPYDNSFFKVYVGDFRTKRDALKVLGRIKKNFPDAFIVEDKIIIEE